MGLLPVRGWLAVSAILFATYLAVGGSRPIYEFFGLASCATILYGVHRNRPQRRAAWWALAFSQGCLGVGDIVYFSGFGPNPPFPSLADAIYIPGVLSLVVALALLVAASVESRDLFSFVDATVFTLAIGLLLWTSLFTPASFYGTPLQRGVSLAYPAIDLALFAGLIRLVLTRGTRSASFYLLLASIVSLILADFSDLTISYQPGGVVDLGWLAGYAFAGAAALHPSMSRFVTPAAGALQARRVVLLGLAVATLPFSALIQQGRTGRVDLDLFAIVGALMLIFVTARVAGLVHTLDRTRVAAEESERRFRLVFERSPIGISVGRGGMMTETNPALHKMLGYTGEQFARMHYTDVTHVDDRALGVQLELEEGRRDAFSIDKRYVRSDGSTVETHVNVALDLTDGLGISLIEDVTERHALEEQLLQSQKMEAIGKLAGGIAHDFNNLMTAVIGYSDLLLAQFEEDDRRHAQLSAIRDSAVRATDLTRQLLAFGRKQTLQATELDLRGVVERMDTLLRRLIGEDIRLETMFGFEEVVVRADPTQLEQVVVNLVVNARDAMPDGGTLVVAVLSDGDEAILTVVDDGVGMDEDVRERIFEPFFTTKPFGEGSGLGLATVHGIVGQSGGTIAVESEPGAGTSFTVRLPLAQPLPVAAIPASLVD